ncbi:hypothetical protein J7L48_08495 [bacterium]|nr:hypothetical protein [bacterium]
MDNEVRALDVIKNEEQDGRKLVDSAKNEANKKIINAKENVKKLWTDAKIELSEYEKKLKSTNKTEIEIEEKKMRKNFQDINNKIEKNSSQNSNKMLKELLKEILKNGS